MITHPSPSSVQARHPLRLAFLKWQCRVRQIAMRQDEGRPSAAMMPDVTLPGDAHPMGAIITVLCRLPRYSVTPEFKHMARRTHDPEQRRSKAIEYLSSTYYQKADQFDSRLAATFLPGSSGAARLLEHGRCTLVFDAFAQRFELDCAITQLQPDDQMHAAAWCHNALFNPNLSADASILAFEPDWHNSFAEPAPQGLG